MGSHLLLSLSLSGAVAADNWHCIAGLFGLCLCIEPGPSPTYVCWPGSKDASLVGNFCKWFPQTLNHLQILNCVIVTVIVTIFRRKEGKDEAKCRRQTPRCLTMTS